MSASLLLSWGAYTVADLLSFGILWYLLNRLFCDYYRGHHAFCRKVFFFFVPLEIPQFGSLFCVSSLRLSSGHSTLVLTWRTDDAAHAYLTSPHSLVADASTWVTSLLGVVVRHKFCLFFFLPGYFALWGSITPNRSDCKRVSYCVEIFPPSWFIPRDEFPSLNLLSLFLSFIFCPTSFQREWVAFLGAWFPPLVFRSCFVEVA